MPRRPKEPKALDGGSPDNAPGPQHNSQARDDIQRECRAGMRDIIAKRKDLNADAGAIRERLKNAGINVEGFMFAVRVGEREQDDRDAFMDGLRESFQALGIGEQGSFLSAIEAVGGTVRVASKPAADDETDVRPAFLRERTDAKDAATQ